MLFTEANLTTTFRLLIILLSQSFSNITYFHLSGMCFSNAQIFLPSPLLSPPPCSRHPPKRRSLLHQHPLPSLGKLDPLVIPVGTRTPGPATTTQKIRLTPPQHPTPPDPTPMLTPPHRTL